MKPYDTVVQEFITLHRITPDQFWQRDRWGDWEKNWQPVK
jgi:hypothetical protein